MSMSLEVFRDAPIQVLAFYIFQPTPQDRVQALRDQLFSLGGRFEMRGLAIVGAEGFNGTFSFPREHAASVKAEFSRLYPNKELPFKDSFAFKHPFDDLKLKVRPEIVTLNRPDLVPQGERHRHLSPADWSRVMSSKEAGQEDVVLIDTRNRYEYEIGHFKGALNPDTRQFTSFPDYVRATGIHKDKKILIYCTGGIRCEKAILEMEDEGYENVYQLEGGILNYLSEASGGASSAESGAAEAGADPDLWQGECFVFDYRVAVDKNLKPTETYKLCPHCGQPAKTEIRCTFCLEPAIVCDHCVELSADRNTCSKNCAHHLRMGHKSRRVQRGGAAESGAGA
jgi:UPF0176 protein